MLSPPRWLTMKAISIHNFLLCYKNSVFSLLPALAIPSGQASTNCPKISWPLLLATWSYHRLTPCSGPWPLVFRAAHLWSGLFYCAKDLCYLSCQFRQGEEYGERRKETRVFWLPVFPAPRRFSSSYKVQKGNAGFLLSILWSLWHWRTGSKEGIPYSHSPLNTHISTLILPSTHTFCLM